MFKFEELRVYQEALEFADQVYTASMHFPKDEMFGLTSQLRRAAVSIALNVAEGSTRSKKDFRHFLDISRGSCLECIAIVSISLKRNYIHRDTYSKLYEKAVILSRMLSKLKNALH